MTVPRRGDFAAHELVGEGLACWRGGRLVFTRLDCRLAAGGALVLTGSNGSGKSSLLRLLATLLAPAVGQIWWGGAPLARDLGAYRAIVHYLGHLDAVKPALTPRETLEFWVALHGLAPSDPEGALDRFGLSAIADWPCRLLSAGQRRRLALARLIATPAPIWLLDEPNTALDADGSSCLIAAIAEHRAEGGRVVIATHQALDLDGADVIALDDFAASADEALAAML